MSMITSNENWVRIGAPKVLHDARKLCSRDDHRRAKKAAQLAAYDIKANVWLDVGTGAGGFLHDLQRRRPDLSLHAVEPQFATRRALQQEGLSVCASLDEIPDGSVDYLSAWHVFEHVTDPLNFVSLSPCFETWRAAFYRSTARP